MTRWSKVANLNSIVQRNRTDGNGSRLQEEMVVSKARSLTLLTFNALYTALRSKKLPRSGGTACRPRPIRSRQKPPFPVVRHSSGGSSISATCSRRVRMCSSQYLRVLYHGKAC